MTFAPAGGRRTAGWAALAAGLSASVAGVVLAIHSGRPAEDAGSVPAAAVAPGSAAAVAPASSPALRPSRGPAPVPSAPAWAVPARVTIGKLRVAAPVDAVGVRADRSLTVPDDPARLGWWIGSATPGSARGTVVIAGHVDTAEDGPGALFRLENLPLGATIEVRAGERVFAYRAVARRSYSKQRLPADLFAPGTAPRLALVTCGGSFHDGVYSHNVVVYAEPV
ncbi:class F sortase [Paractinoplanes maris]|uniref:class F sortase n=1 Tax=Paractinoplanes maris TaxID=1734446 RepID=UPI0020229376|nr:class F sortase [Actinoplanes maris]